MSGAVDPRLAELGAAVARSLDAAAPRERRAAQRERFLDAASVPTRRAPRWPVAVAACALAALAVARRPREAPAPRALVATTLRGRALAPGQWIAREGAEDAIRFSDRSAVTLGRGAQVRLGALSPHGADLYLERGVLDVEVSHRDRARWRFYAGPWTVAVTGTAFRVAWSPTTGRLDLAMRDGRVVVTGPRTASGRAVTAGEHVTADLSRGVIVALERPAESEVEVAARALTVVPAAPPRITPPAQRPRRVPRAAAVDAGAVAQPLARVAAAPARDALHDALDEADRARFEGRVTDARALLLDLRARYPGTPESARAAHNLGVLSLESLRAPAVAARWFEIALREAPSGPLARESLGRRVQALREAGDDIAARAAATDYLARDPDGAFAPFARSVLAR